jgi:hypothetical protein
MRIKTLAYALALVALFWALVGVGVAYAHPPWPDSAVGKHEAVKPDPTASHSYYVHHIVLKGRPGHWTCKITTGKKYMLCWPEPVQ